MIFSSIEFVFFFPAVFVVYWLLPRRAWLQNSWLLLCSYVFIASWSLKLFPVFLVATLVDYAAGQLIGKWRDDRPRAARAVLWLSILYNIGQLFWWKYEGFFADSLNGLLYTQLPVLHLILPVGLSFYTFQKIAYVVDVYDGKIAPCRNPLTFATYVAFFPQIVAGPIVRGGDLLPQWEKPRLFDADRLASAGAIFLVGWIKKAFVADWLGQYIVDPIFAADAQYSTAGHWIAIVAYWIQIYCDFSGYSEMAIGAGRALGIELPVNFNYPMLSKSVAELWRRWHITLNTWLFEYIYGPLTLSKGFFKGRLDMAFLVTFLASGLWHGPRWTYITWGLLHAVALIVHRRWDEYYRGLCRKDRKWVARRKTLGYAAWAWIGTQLWFLLTLIPFRAPTLGGAAHFVKSMFLPHAGLRWPTEIVPPARTTTFAMIVFVLVAYHVLETPRGRRAREILLGAPASIRGIAYGALIVFLYLFGPQSASTFVYAQF
jgi:alginate O-acetyltransferase complex protein AlgI